LNHWSSQLLNKIETSKPSEKNADIKSSSKSNDDLIMSISEEIQKFDGYFNEISNDLSAYDVRQTQIVTMQIKEKFLGLQDSLKPKKKFGFKSRNKKVRLNFLIILLLAESLGKMRINNKSTFFFRL